MPPFNGSVPSRAAPIAVDRRSFGGRTAFHAVRRILVCRACCPSLGILGNLWGIIASGNEANVRSSQ